MYNINNKLYRAASHVTDICMNSNNIADIIIAFIHEYESCLYSFALLHFLVEFID